MKPLELLGGAKDRYLLSVNEASAWLGIPVFTLYSWALSRRIPHYKIGRRVMFSMEGLKQWVDDQRVEKVG